jgi:hypothetical protein
MDNLFANVFPWVVRLVGLYFMYRVLRNFRPNIFYKGWGNLEKAYAVAGPLPPALKLDSISGRVGSETYNDTLAIALDEQGVYLQRSLLAKARGTLYIPFARFRLMEAPKASGPFGVRVYGIFEVDGVDVWLDQPYAQTIISQLSPS